MKRKSGKKHTGRTYLLFALLALLCVGIAELAACRFFAPALYQQITSPVRRCLQSVAELGVHTAAEVSAWWSALTAPEEDLADPQLAGEPAILSEGPISDPSLTELKESDGKEVLTGGIIPSFIITRGMRPGRSSHMAATTSGTTAADPRHGDGCVQHGRLGQGPRTDGTVGCGARILGKGRRSYLSIVEGTAAAMA